MIQIEDQETATKTNTVDTPNSVISNPNRCSYIWNQTKINAR